jgi:hypothetical protein
MSEHTEPDRSELPLDVLDRIDRACDRFEAALRRGEEPDPEDFLGAVAPEYRPALLRDLRAAEADARRRRAGVPASETFAPSSDGGCPQDAKAATTRPGRETSGLPLLPGGTTEHDRDATLSYSVARPGGRLEPLLTPDQHQRLRDAFVSGGVIEGRYLIERELGRGGMGQVYLGRDLRLARPVAIKVSLLLGRQQGLSEARLIELRGAFAEEARIGANLTHPAIATVYDYGFHEGKPFTVFEYLPGQTLRELLRHRDRLPLEEVRLIIGPLAQALDFAHARHVVHRDLKPDNVRATEQGLFKVIDLGLAKEFRREVDWSGFAGTPAYAAPEQAAGLPCDGRTDQYALAVIAFELLTGRRPFEECDWRVLLDKHRNAEPPSPRTLQPDLPDGVCEALIRALQKDPNLRHPSCEAFAVAVGCRLLSSPPASGEILLEGDGSLVIARSSVRLLSWRARIALSQGTLLVAMRGVVLRLPLTAIEGVSCHERRKRLRVEFRRRPGAPAGRIGFRCRSHQESRDWHDRIRILVDAAQLKAPETEDPAGLYQVPLLGWRPDARFQVVGPVEVRSARRAEARARLQLLAASKGAHSVVDVREEWLDGYDRSERRLSGVAVRAVDPKGMLELNRQAFTSGVLRTTAWIRWGVAYFTLAALFMLALGAWSRISLGYRAPRGVREDLFGLSLSELRDCVLVVLISAAWPLGLSSLLRWLRWPQLILPATIAILGLIASPMSLGIGEIWGLEIWGLSRGNLSWLSNGFVRVGISGGIVVFVTGLGAAITRSRLGAGILRDEALGRTVSYRRVAGMLAVVASAIYALAVSGGMGWVGYRLVRRGLDEYAYFYGAWQLADAHFWSAQAKLLKDPHDAEEEFQRALTLWKSLARACPHTPTHQDGAWANVAITYGHLAELQRHAGRLVQAEQSLGSALIIVEKLVSECPDRPDYRRFLEHYRSRLDRIVGPRDRFQDSR